MEIRPALRPHASVTTSTGRLALVAKAIRCSDAKAHGQRIALETQRLIMLGHRRILLVTAGEPPIAELQAHSQVMLAEGLPLLPCLELDTAAALCWPELVSRLQDAAPTALLCTRATVLQALQTALSDHGERPSLTITGPEARTGADSAYWH